MVSCLDTEELKFAQQKVVERNHVEEFLVNPHLRVHHRHLHVHRRHLHVHHRHLHVHRRHLHVHHHALHHVLRHVHRRHLLLNVLVNVIKTGDKF